jgi:hypothetical protein
MRITSTWFCVFLLPWLDPFLFVIFNFLYVIDGELSKQDTLISVSWLLQFLFFILLIDHYALFFNGSTL